MTFYQGLAAVLLKMLGASIVVWSVIQLGYFIGTRAVSSTDIDPVLDTIAAFSPTALSLAFGGAIWSFAIPLGKNIMKGVTAPDPQFGLAAEQVVAIGVFLIGVFYLIEYGPTALSRAAAAFYEYGVATDTERLAGKLIFSRYDWSEFASNVILAGAALALVLRARGVGKIYVWLREEAGLRKPDGEPSAG